MRDYFGRREYMRCNTCGAELTLEEESNVTRLRDQPIIAVCDKCREPSPRTVELLDEKAR